MFCLNICSNFVKKYMKVIKIILGVIIGIAAIFSTIDTASTESGAGLAGVLTAFLLMGALSAWLIYSGLNKK